jgi:hypothetical protein
MLAMLVLPMRKKWLPKLTWWKYKNTPTLGYFCLSGISKVLILARTAALTAFDKLFNGLSTLSADFTVKVGTVFIANRLPTLSADFFVELGTVTLSGSLSAFATGFSGSHCWFLFLCRFLLGHNSLLSVFIIRIPGH